MNKILSLVFSGLLALAANAQTTPSTAPTTQPFGKIDKADLELKACDFEKDANAEVLFDKGSVYFDQDYNLIFDRHIRIKIFNDNGKDEANVKIRFYGGNNAEYISNVQAETMNLNNGAVEIVKVDKKQIFTQRVDNFRKEIVFSFPNVKPGCVVEYKYTSTRSSVANFPDWYFQTHIPTRYSEISATIPNILYYKNLSMVSQPFVKNTDEVKALANVPSIGDEPFMSSRIDNYQRILYELKSISAPGFQQSFSDTWQKVGKNFVENDYFGGQFKRKLAGEEDIVNKAKGLGADPQKIAYVFNEVKSRMKWNGEDEQYTDDGTAEAWTKKTGNSTEINLILNHLLQKAGVKSMPMLVSTKENGKINPAYPNGYQFNRTVAYIPVDSANYYILDATNKYNTFNEIPRTVLNSFGFYIDKDNEKYDLFFINKSTPVREVSVISAEIKPDGKMTGAVQVNSFSYNRIADVEKYKTDGEEKYIKQLSNGDNSLKIVGLKLDNMETDTLPLTQNFNFTVDLTGSDESYIYFKPNLFASAFENDFLSEHRYTDIDFGFMSSDVINGSYKLPAGFKVDAMPKNVSLAMPDKSIIFKRLVAEQEGTIIVRYSLFFKKALFFKENYPEFHDFYKKMNEMMGEQIVLKKG
jgi:hypothetical protein